VRLDLHQLRELYAHSSLVVMPLRESDFQAGVTTLLEAMAMGMPIVCSRTTGQTDVIDDGVTGVYVPPGDAAALHTAIASLLADPERRRMLGNAARKWVTNTADIEVYVERLKDLVDRQLTLGRPT
jgi:glycosyltransferase involved in cell wall biosynthesis